MANSKLTIRIDGVGTINKGAELMLYAILQEIDASHPSARVVYNDSGFLSDNRPAAAFDTKVQLTKPWYTHQPVASLIKESHLDGIIARLNKHWSLTNYLSSHFLGHTDLLLNAAGYSVSDLFKIGKSGVERRERYYKRLKESGAKIVLLPQAFGPCEKAQTKAMVDVINRYADMVFAREQVSYDYLVAEGFNREKLFLSPDFTCTVTPTILPQYSHLADAVAIIPNMKMVETRTTKEKGYGQFLTSVIEACRQAGKTVFMLNHEGVGDEALCRKIAQQCGIEVVTGLNALETKGVISQCQLVISSRFHGVANALSSGVPCLATSWSHKYELLFADYGLTDCVLDTANIDDAIARIMAALEPAAQQTTRAQLQRSVEACRQQVAQMWQQIWQYLENKKQ